MARLEFVKSSRPTKKGGPRPQCGKCRREIAVGESYYHWSTRIGSSSHRYVRCVEHRPRPSEMQSSQYKAAAYAACEEMEDAAADLTADGIAPLIDAVRSAIDTIQFDCADALNEAADNIESGFGHETSQSQELRDRASMYEEWLSELENLISELEAHVEEEPSPEDLDDLMQAVQDAVGACPE